MCNLIDQVRANEPGNRMYTLCRDDDGNFLMLELYDSQEDLDAHRETEHFRAAGPGLAGLMSGPPAIQVLQVVKE